MRPFREFDILLLGLKPGKHVFEHQINNRFFSMFENSIVEEAQLQATVSLTKTELLLTARFEIVGTVTLICDRTLKPFGHPLHIDHNIYFKNGPTEEEVSEDVYHITPKTDSINTAQFIFELVTLSVPLKKLHPEAQAADANHPNDNTTGSLVYSSHQANDQEQPNPNDSQPTNGTDPRWDALKKLRKK